MANGRGGDPLGDKAYQALEDALQPKFDDKGRPRAGARPDGREANVADNMKQRPKTAAEQAARRPGAEAPRPAPEGPKGQSGAPANDGRRSPSAMLRNLEGASMRAAIRNATLISLLWTAVVIGAAQGLYGEQLWQFSAVSDVFGLPRLILLLLAIVLPVMMIFAYSVMIARAQDMRNAARSMAELALRLVEPENIASDRIMNVGQAVRREVTAMNEGIERTIARATELEALLHSEVNPLERSYADNEMRVRSPAPTSS